MISISKAEDCCCFVMCSMRIILDLVLWHRALSLLQQLPLLTKPGLKHMQLMFILLGSFATCSMPRLLHMTTP